MNNNFKIFNITFDTKVKILIIFCVIIAIAIIFYSFYYICLNSNKKIQESKVNSFENIINVLAYEAEYTITVNSNKTANNYDVYEDVDFENNLYNMIINNELNISITSDTTNFKKEDMNYEYLNTNLNLKNPIAFSSIISSIKKITSGEIKGKITKIEQNDRLIYQIIFEKEYIEKIKKIEICVLKENCKIFEINMYNNDENEQYSIIFQSFKVKK